MKRELIIGGHTKLTTQDYPGHLSTTVFCVGCPWKCDYCHNRHLQKRGDNEIIPWSDIISFLHKRQGILEAVVFSGGEPTIQQGLYDAMVEVKELGFKVALHTGGMIPDMVERVLSVVDWVGLDIKAKSEDYDTVTHSANSGSKPFQALRLIIESGVDYEVRTTPLEQFDNTRYITEMAQELQGMGVNKYIIQARRSMNNSRYSLCNISEVDCPIIQTRKP